MTGYRLWVLLSALSLGVTMGCAGRQAVPRPVAQLDVQARPANAGVFVDDRRVGSARSVSERALRLSVGAHFISVRASGYFPHDERIELTEGENSLQVELVPIPR